LLVNEIASATSVEPDTPNVSAALKWRAVSVGDEPN
jgi:hypothetical protein